MGRVIILTIITVAIIFLEYKKRKNLKKSIIAIVLFGYILMSGYSGYILTKVIAPLFFIHLLAILLCYIALIYYIIKDKLYWQIFLIPIFTIAGYFILNYIDGSRYEG